MKTSKTIGLIGGMGWESSKRYYEQINQKTHEILGGSHSAKIIMISVDFAIIEKRTFEEDWDGIGRIMAKSAQQLQKAGADVVLLCTNLIHLVSNLISRSITIPFLHIAEATGVAIQKKGLKKVLLLGTKFTMEKDFYTHILTHEYGLEIIVPAIHERQQIHDLIYTELVKGIFNKKTKQQIISIIKNIQTQGVEGVILGCTELSLLISEHDIDIPSFDTGKIHAYAAVAWACENVDKAQTSNL